MLSALVNPRARDPPIWRKYRRVKAMIHERQIRVICMPVSDRATRRPLMPI
jgi:hypothetical protein